MSILTPAFCSSPKAAMTGYLLEGISVIPLIGKRASVVWNPYTRERAKMSDITHWEREGQLRNVGVVCGAISGNLIVIDLDGQWAVDTFRAAFPRLVNTFTVTTGSGGQHLYLKVDQLPPNRKWARGEHSGIEIRGEGQYVVAPPSVHPDSHKPYVVALPEPVLKVFEINAVSEWLNEQIGTKKPAKPASATNAGRPLGFAGDHGLVDKSGQVVRNPRAYAIVSLGTEADRVAATPHGARNDTLNLAAFRMAQFVKRGLLTESEVENALLNAARRWSGSDQSEAAILKTIRSGLEDGRAASDGR